jgi:hypothetical protein
MVDEGSEKPPGHGGWLPLRERSDALGATTGHAAVHVRHGGWRHGGGASDLVGSEASPGHAAVRDLDISLASTISQIGRGSHHL